MGEMVFFTKNGGWGYDGGDEKSLHSWQKVTNPPIL